MYNLDLNLFDRFLGYLPIDSLGDVLLSKTRKYQDTKTTEVDRVSDVCFD